MNLVSVVIPTYNSAPWIATAIESALNQTVSDVEIIVVDDGSADDTAVIVRTYAERVKYLRQENAGVAVARNRGVEASTGKYVAFLDSDDAWLPGKLEAQLAAIESAPECRAAYTALMICGSDLEPIRRHTAPRRSSAIEDLLLTGNCIGTPSTVICERQLLMETGGFDPACSMCADWEMWIRLAVRTEFAKVDEPLVLYRIHGSNMSRNIPLLETDSLRTLNKGFALPEISERLRGKRQDALARNFAVLALSYAEVGSFGSGLRCAAKAVAMDFSQAGNLLAAPFRYLGRGRRAREARSEIAS